MDILLMGMTGAAIVRARQGLLAAGVVTGALLLQGCATRASQPVVTAQVQGSQVECRDWWTALDAEVHRASVGDAEARPLRGFPGFRSSRLLHGLRTEAAASHTAYEA